jgi:hypothetical protein
LFSTYKSMTHSSFARYRLSIRSQNFSRSTYDSIKKRRDALLMISRCDFVMSTRSKYIPRLASTFSPFRNIKQESKMRWLHVCKRLLRVLPSRICLHNTYSGTFFIDQNDICSLLSIFYFIYCTIQQHYLLKTLLYFSVFLDNFHYEFF